MNKTQTLTRNSLSSIGVSISNNLVSVITLPYYLSTYGDTLWGIYLWVMALSGMLTSFDLGIKSGLRRFVARYTGHGRSEELEVGLSISLVIVGSVALINFVVLILMSRGDSFGLEISPEFVDERSTALLLASFYALSFWGRKVTEAILEGYQLYVTKNRILFVSTVMYFALYLVVQKLRLNFILFVGLSFLVKAIPFFLNLYVIRYKKLLQGVKINLRIKGMDLKTDFFRFSSDMFILALLEMFVFKLDTLLIGGILSAALITTYTVVTKPMFVIKTIDGFVFSALQPMIAREHARNNSSFLDKVIRTGAELNFAIILPLCLLTILLLQPFLSLWVGESYNDYIVWGKIAVLIYVFKPFFGIIVKFLVNTGVTREMKQIRFLTASTNLILSIVLSFNFNIGGVILGTLISNFIGIPLYLLVGKNKLNLGFGDILSQRTVINIIYLGFLYVLLTEIIIFNPGKSWVNFVIYASITGVVSYAISAYTLLKSSTTLRRWTISKLVK